MQLRVAAILLALVLGCRDSGLSVCAGECGKDSDCAENGRCDTSTGRCSCAPGFIRCGGFCEMAGTPLACGGCNRCPAPEEGVATCTEGLCGFACVPGYYACGGTCVRDDPSACGPSCTPCPTAPGAVAECRDGTCVLVCPAGFHACGGACVSSEDVASCGGSCTPCPTPVGGVALCRLGACEVRCDPGLLGCGSRCLAPGEGVWTLRLPEAAYTGLRGGAVAAADFDEDARVDLVVEGPGTAAFLRNGGYGVFEAPRFVPLLEGPIWSFDDPRIRAADVNRDGHLDLVALANAWAIVVVMGRGDGTFGPPLVTSLSVPAEDLVVTDVDGDGHLDAAVTRWLIDEGNLEVLRGDGSGLFTAAWTLTGPFGSIASADLDRDGKAEIVSAGFVVQLGAAGLEVRWTDGSSGWNVRSVALGDVTGDGKPDLVRVLPSPAWLGLVEVLAGRGTGFAAPETQYPALCEGSGGAAVVDADGDGTGDVVVVGVGVTFGSVAVLRNAGGGALALPIVFHVEDTSPPGLSVADLDGDGLPDFSVPSEDLVVETLLGGCL